MRKIRGSSLKEVDNIVYLGFCISEDGDIRAEKNTLLGKSTYALNCLNNACKEDGLPLATKLKLFNVIVISVILLHGCESWKGLEVVEDEKVWFRSCYLRKINAKL